MLKKMLVGLVMLIASIGMAIAAVNINTATQEELESLPEIGPVKAKAIIDYRKANGNFKSIDDIKSVKGIGDGNLFTKIKPKLSVSGATVVEAAPAKPAKAEKAAKAEVPAKTEKEAKKAETAAKSGTK